MITLRLNKSREFKVGEVLHLKVVAMDRVNVGRWILRAEDITPLPGAEPTGYACRICGLVESAKPDGSLPEGWVEKKYEQGSCFFCSDDSCEPICRVCGCVNHEACETEEGPCHWVEADLCSACAEKKKG